MTAFFFYLLATFTLVSAALVITVRNPVHAVLFLILAFFNAAGLMLLLGAEFVAMILVIVYVGAVAVLFLFVVMMLDINVAGLRGRMVWSLPMGAAVGTIFLVELLVVAGAWMASGGAQERFELARLRGAHSLESIRSELGRGVTNTEAIGALLYDDYIYAFQASGLILLVAMIGAIVLTLRQRPGVRRQDAVAQTMRRASDVLVVRGRQPLDQPEAKVS